MFDGFYQELEEIRVNGSPEADFGFLENVPVGDSYNLYDFLHGHCDEFAVALSDYFGYPIEYVLDNSETLIHAYCVTEVGGEKAYVDARGITTEAELFFDEFADWCTYEEADGLIYDSQGECRVLGHKDTREMYSDENVATVEYKGHVFSLEAHGDVSVALFSNERLYEVEYYYKNKNNSGAYQDEEALKYFVDDSHFKGLNNDSRLEWQNNNWFEIFVETPEGIRECIEVCSFDNIDECIFEMVEVMDEVILEREKKSNIDKLIAKAEDMSKETNNALNSKVDMDLEK